MIAIVTLLLALPLGYVVRSRTAAFVIYAVGYLWAFTFQTLYLLLASLGPGEFAAFRPGEFPLSYGLVTVSILLMGSALVCLGHWLRSRRAVRNTILTEVT
ncbi:hypothetical protein MLP_12620 [Microlunatus phosphovorus NM-1]|jgi:hypothetical protein|uniref:Integral membrane protein n=1 Tax=Microlunatus phosphovorus (strain ATCC 700054 / DSM 10555 / JCM 9379 / NBRC 101784 / NCIMB 13414 / VKM Ac-1990 / NM-1) TaxID=1032480 RepID=F5XPG8_MICPN|nr:hypothetical protein [Microlunatus phosphovorus]BAK34276.1 hypothetical protein MLP_12620 [Microlunatus phosphovorus NM-1]